MKTYDGVPDEPEGDGEDQAADRHNNGEGYSFEDPSIKYLKMEH